MIFSHFVVIIVHGLTSSILVHCQTLLVLQEVTVFSVFLCSLVAPLQVQCGCSVRDVSVVGEENMKKLRANNSIP